MILKCIISNSRTEAENICLDLLEKKLVFSVNIIPNMPSMRWEDDKIVKITRTIVLAKTKALLYERIEDEVKRVKTTGSAICFTMPITQMTDDVFNSIQLHTLKV